MAKRAIARCVLVIVLLAFGASAILSAVEAYGSMHAKSGGGQYNRMTSPDKASWPEAAERDESSPLAASAVLALVVLVILQAAVIIYRERKEPTVRSEYD